MDETLLIHEFFDGIIWNPENTLEKPESDRKPQKEISSSRGFHIFSFRECIVMEYRVNFLNWRHKKLSLFSYANLAARIEVT